MVMNSFGNRNFMHPMGRLSMHSKCIDFFSFKFFFGGGGGGERLFFLFSFVPNMFPSSSQMGFPRVFPIAPHFNPICFAQSPPLLTNIGGPNGDALHLSIKFAKPP